MNTNLQEVPPQPLAIGRDWQSFADRLAAALATLKEDQNLILTAEHRQRYVQFSGSGASGLRAEAVSNGYLAEDGQLAPDQIAALTAAGWRKPTHAPDAGPAERDRVGSPNFFVDFDAPVPFDEVAGLAVRTLAEVFEVSSPDLLEYDAFDARSNQLSFAELCRRRALRPSTTSDSQPSLPKDLLATMREITGMGHLDFDADGDICLSLNSQVVFVRCIGTTPFVRIWSPLLRGVEETPELLAKLNLLNSDAGFVRFCVHDGAIFAEADMAAEPVVAKLVDRSLCRFCGASDGVDTLLQREFGGRTAFDVPPRDALLH